MDKETKRKCLKVEELENPFEDIIFKKEPLGELSEEAQERHREFMDHWVRVTAFHSSVDLFAEELS